MHLIDGKKIAQEIEANIRKKAAGRDIRVATIFVKGNEASSLYAKLKEQACMRVGFSSITKSFPPETTTDELVDTITALNNDSSIHGIMVQQPLPLADSEKVVSAIAPSKDIEGLHPFNLGRTLLGEEHLVPCTPLAVLRILEHEKIDPKGKHVVIVNHSNIIGKPLAMLMVNRNATVTVCHVYTKHLAIHTRQADILATGVGVKGLITAEHVKAESTVIDMAIIPEKNGVYGDVNPEDVKNSVRTLTPVPGGVGPVTVAVTLNNVLIAVGIEKD